MSAIIIKINDKYKYLEKLIEKEANLIAYDKLYEEYIEKNNNIYENYITMTNLLSNIGHVELPINYNGICIDRKTYVKSCSKCIEGFECTYANGYFTYIKLRDKYFNNTKHGTLIYHIREKNHIEMSQGNIRNLQACLACKYGCKWVINMQEFRIKCVKINSDIENKYHMPIDERTGISILEAMSKIVEKK